MAEATADSASASESRRPAPSARRTLWTAAALLVALGVLAWATRADTPRLVTEGPLRLFTEAEAAVDDAIDGEGAAGLAAIQITPEFQVETATTLSVEISREPAQGWLGVGCALIDLEHGHARDFTLEAGPDELVASALVDRVQPGRYVLHVAPAWEAIAATGPGRVPSDAAAPAASIRVALGERSRWGFWLAVILILLPAAIGLLRGRQRERKAGEAPERQEASVLEPGLITTQTAGSDES